MQLDLFKPRFNHWSNGEKMNEGSSFSLPPRMLGQLHQSFSKECDYIQLFMLAAIAIAPVVAFVLTIFHFDIGSIQ